MIKTILTTTFTLLYLSLFAQEVPPDTLRLDDLSAFRDQAGNWRIVGEVRVDPDVDIHDAADEPPGQKKKRRAKPSANPGDSTAMVTQGPVRYRPGTGILLNINDDQRKDHLLTTWEHGDLELDLEVMIPKGSNSGIYLQGRYEVQLLDSWGKKRPGYGDIGGIYRNWEEDDPAKMYPGKAPLVNAAKAPGLWQHLHIWFRAPRFDEEGNKTENARFVRVELNGERIHENLEVPLPTGGPLVNDEVPHGPLMIQGDHGPVAFRHIRYRMMEDTRLAVADIQYQVFENASDNLDSLRDASAAQAGPLDKLSSALPGVEDDFTVLYQGVLQTPEAGPYRLRANYNGSLMMLVGGDTVINATDRDDRHQSESFALMLPAGATPFTLLYFKDNAQWNPRLGLFSVDSYPRPLHAPSSFITEPPETGPIYVAVQDEPRLLRAFLDYQGDPDQRLTHTIGVGDPSGVHYVYNLITGSPVCVWRGHFLDATPMWYKRGDGSFRPRGATQYLYAGPSLAEPDTADGLPTALNEPGSWDSQGYRIDEATGLPVFLYQRDGRTVEDFIAPDSAGKLLTRTLTFTEGSPDDGAQLKLAEGRRITLIKDGTYAVDQQFYIRVPPDQEVTIRPAGQQQALVAPLSDTFTYSIIW